MALWGITDADESKPKWLTTAQKKEIYANNSGWVVEGGSAQTGNDNADAQPEVLCCVGDLATAVGSADIGEVEWITTTADKSEGFTISVRVRYNEPVDVVTTGGTPTLAVTNSNDGTGSGRGPHSLSYASGTGTNELIFSLAIAAANAATNADDVLSVGAQTIALNSGTMKDASGTASDAALVISGALGTAAGTVTVTA
jgi:hypothetical protein